MVSQFGEMKARSTRVLLVYRPIQGVELDTFTACMGSLERFVCCDGLQMKGLKSVDASLIVATVLSLKSTFSLSLDSQQSTRSYSSHSPPSSGPTARASLMLSTRCCLCLARGPSR